MLPRLQGPDQLLSNQEMILLKTIGQGKISRPQLYPAPNSFACLSLFISYPVSSGVFEQYCFAPWPSQAPLPCTIAPVNKYGCSRSVGRRIASKINKDSFELFGLAVAAEGNHGFPLLFRLVRNVVGQPRRNIPRRHGIDTNKVSPLVAQRLCQMYTAGFGNVVTSLLLREVGNVARHGRSDDE